MSNVSVKWNGDAAKAVLKSGCENGIRGALQFVLEEARRQVPHDTGALERSGAIDAEGFEGTVSFDTPYAIEQHENRKYRHEPGRKAKYLEDPVNNGSIRAMVVRYIQDSLHF